MRSSPDEALGIRARPESLQLTLRFSDARPQLFNLVLQFATFFEQGFRNPEISRAMFAHENVVCDLAGAERAFHRLPRYGEIFRVKFADPDRPSLSFTSTRMGCFPAGISAAGTSMPLGPINDFTRSVRSTGGTLRYVIFKELGSIFAPP